MTNLIITIDGPAASGKSTVARLLAEKLKISFLDTGAMYRAVTLAAMQTGIDLDNQQKLLQMLQSRKFEFSANKAAMTTCIDGVDVTERLRSDAVTGNARHIADQPKIREELVRMQKEFADRQQNIVTEGRDQGTVAFPNAHIKFYLNADLRERAARRRNQLLARGDRKSLREVLEAIRQRDQCDRSRAVGPLLVPNEAVVVNTTDLTLEQVVDKLIRCVKEKCSKIA